MCSCALMTYHYTEVEVNKQYAIYNRAFYSSLDGAISNIAHNSYVAIFVSDISNPFRWPDKSNIFGRTGM